MLVMYPLVTLTVIIVVSFCLKFGPGGDNSIPNDALFTTGSTISVTPCGISCATTGVAMMFTVMLFDPPI
jgi:hypothetical protein